MAKMTFKRPAEDDIEKDSFYSWIVCAGSFLTFMLTAGFSWALGVYYVVSNLIIEI